MAWIGGCHRDRFAIDELLRGAVGGVREEELVQGHEIREA